MFLFKKVHVFVGVLIFSSAIHYPSWLYAGQQRPLLVAANVAAL